MTIRRAIPNLLSRDLDASRDFYEGFLGFRVAMDEEGFMMFASRENSAVQLTVASPDGGLDRGVAEARVSIDVADVDAVHAEAVRRNLEIVYPLTDEPWGIRRFFVKDPSGVVINVACHIDQGPGEGQAASE
jgi:catechol 2,3-dioxygenase-like lactoylglutathione lyase family enzyme